MDYLDIYVLHNKNICTTYFICRKIPQFLWLEDFKYNELWKGDLDLQQKADFKYQVSKCIQKTIRFA